MPLKPESQTYAHIDSIYTAKTMKPQKININCGSFIGCHNRQADNSVFISREA